MSELKRTQLYNEHVKAGATMVDFGGWDMPVQYPSGIVAEHLIPGMPAVFLMSPIWDASWWRVRTVSVSCSMS